MYVAPWQHSSSISFCLILTKNSSKQWFFVISIRLIEFWIGIVFLLVIIQNLFLYAMTVEEFCSEACDIDIQLNVFKWFCDIL